MIVDTHLHVWRLHSVLYPWKPLADVVPDHEWPVESQIQVMDKYGIDKGVLVQPSMYSFDNRYILDCDRSYPDRFALVGLLDPQADSVESAMESLADQGVRGLRLAPMLRPDIAWCNDDRADRVWRKAGKLSMILTLLVKPDQVALVSEAIERFPEVQVVIDHLARPDLAEEHARTTLFKDLLALAQFEQVYVKASALGYMSGEPYPHRDILEFVRRAFDAYGPQRMMWGTDTPMSQDPNTLPDAMRLIDLALPDASHEDRAQIMGGTAAQLWNLA